MGRKDVRVGEVNRYLKDAQKKRDQAASILRSTPKSADRGRDDALRAGSLLRDAARLADSATSTAEKYKEAAQTGDAAQLLADAQAFKQQFDNTGPILEALANPHSSSSQRNLKKTLKEKSREVAADQIADELMTRLIQYATMHTIDGIVSAALAVPTPGLRWAGRGLAEAIDAGRQKYRNARSGVDPVTGNCTPARMCHNCRAGRSMNCQNHY